MRTIRIGALRTDALERPLSVATRDLKVFNAIAEGHAASPGFADAVIAVRKVSCVNTAKNVFAQALLYVSKTAVPYAARSDGIAARVGAFVAGLFLSAGVAGRDAARLFVADFLAVAEQAVVRALVVVGRKDTIARVAGCRGARYAIVTIALIQALDARVGAFIA